MTNLNNENTMVRMAEMVNEQKVAELSKYKRLNELADVVECYLENNSDVEGRFLLIEKGIFLETLIDTKEVPSKEKTQGFEFEYHFLNRRISMKFEQTYVEVADLIDREEFFQQVVLTLTEHISGLEGEFVRVDRFGKDDDISRMVLIIDKRCKDSVLRDNGIIYNNNDKGYDRFMDNAVMLDDNVEEENPESNKIGYYISEEDVIKQVSNSDEDWELVENLMDSMRLTKRQKEVLSTYMYCGENITHTANELDISVRGMRKNMRAIEQRAEKYFGIEQDVVNIQTPMLELRDLLESEDFNEGKLISFLKDNINDINIEELVYSTNDEKRRTFIRILNQKPVEEKEIRVFATEFLSKYYAKY